MMSDKTTYIAVSLQLSLFEVADVLFPMVVVVVVIVGVGVIVVGVVGVVVFTIEYL